MKVTLRLILFLSVIILVSCKSKQAKTPRDSAYLIHELNLALTEAVVQDGFSPPVASRVYAYPNITAYEAVIQNDSNFISYAGQLKGLDALPQMEAEKKYSQEIVLVKSFCDVARAMVYRDHLIDAEEKRLLVLLEKETDAETFNNSIAFGTQLSEAILKWANADGYSETRNMPKFTVVDTAGSWLPTPPKYMEALEPHFMKVRPFVLDSTSQFREALWYQFSTDTASEFYKRTKEVYTLANTLTEEQLAIAWYWDCNPSPADIQGHVMTTKRQNTPGGHWLGIAKIAAKKNHLNLPATCAVLSKTAIALADAFKVIWDTKCASNNIRPVTYIGKYIDPNWSPLLETPNFPEFSSGHSCISAAAAYVLTQEFGENYSFIDSTNVPFGISPRTFSSFNEAAKEAAISRVYGGIHYIPSCEIGGQQGTKVGEVVADRIVTGKQSDEK
ncbi:MAG: vanadium-dependent haloperoxidase [Chitinophagales bacterium]|nr:vanadium-dependent haloperoxidase [Chitinophagales bacterium]